MAVVLFPIVYFGMLWLGKQLRQRWNVRLGPSYHLICVANALFVSARYMNLKWEELRVLTAAACMLDSLLLLTLFNRFYWEGYFAKKRNMVAPRFFTHATRLIGITAAAVLVLQFVFDVRVPGLIAGIGAVERSVARQCVVQRLPLVEAGGQDLEGGLAGGEQGFFHRAAAINRVGAAVMARYVLAPNKYRRNAQ